MKAKLTQINVSPKKLRLVANLVKGMETSLALEFLKNVDKKGAEYVAKTIKSAVANAMNENIVENQTGLKITTIFVNQCLKLKRYKMGSRSRIKPITRKLSTLHIELS